MSQNDEDIAQMIASVYLRSADRGEFIEIMSGYPYLKKTYLNDAMLFALCNKTWHGGYIQGLEDQ